MDPARDVLPRETPPDNAADLTRDLQLDTVVEAMAGGDEVIDAAAREALLNAPENAPEVVRYRQAVLADCLAHPRLLRSLYATACEAMQAGRSGRFGLGGKLSSVVLTSANDLIGVLIEHLDQLRRLGGAEAGRLQSDGLADFCRRLTEDITDADLATVRSHLEELRFRRGFLVSARLGEGNRGTDHTVRRLPDRDRSRLKRWMTARPTHYTYEPSERDEKARVALREMRDQQLAPIADIVRQTASDLRAFFERLRAELAFYVGALNLHERLAERDLATAYPGVHPPDEDRWSADGLYDVALALTSPDAIVANDIRADGRRTLVVTGANQGGKSTFLRSVGQCQLMAQAGLFVGARAADLSACDGVRTHFRREEDATMRSGKLDEELGRLSTLVASTSPRTLVLSNESCAVTNQREGSQILYEIATALRDYGTRAVYVTHMYEFAVMMTELRAPDILMLRAERRPDGRRTFRVEEGEPEDTSYGADLYGRVFGVGDGSDAG